MEKIKHYLQGTSCRTAVLSDTLITFPAHISIEVNILLKYIMRSNEGFYEKG